MSLTWRILVTAPDGTPKTTITSTAQVASIDSLQVDGGGSCLEASLTAVPTAVDLGPRDVITVQASSDGFASVLASFFKGYITSAGAQRGSRLQTFRAVGLKQRAYEVPITAARIAGADVATMAYGVFNTYLNPAIVRGADLLFGSPRLLGFQLGDRYPALETAGDLLDALAATVGAFTVPAGESYTYNGHVYAAGELVPAVRWGAGVNGLWFFHRPQGRVALNEGARRVDVEWTARSAEEVFDRAILIYATELNGDAVVRTAAGEQIAEPNPRPLFLASGSGPYQATRVEVLDAPLDFMVDDPASQMSSGTITDPGNAYDGNPLTYAEFLGAGESLLVQSQEPGIARVRVRVNDQTIGISATAVPPNVEIELSWWNGATLRGSSTYRLDPTVAAEERTVILPVLAPAAFADVLTGFDRVYRVRVYGASGVRCYELAYFVPEPDAAERLAEALQRPPTPEVATIRYQGVINTIGAVLTPTGHPAVLELTDLTGATVAMPVERYDASLTVDGGALLTVHAGQAFDADAEAQRVVLERLARRAVAKGGARR